MNLHGYPAFFRDLLNPPPWVEVQPEDCEGPLTPDRAAQLSSTYLQLLSDSDAAAKFKQYLSAQRDTLSRLFSGELSGALEIAHVLEGEDFDELIRLAQILGSKTEQF